MERLAWLAALVLAIVVVGCGDAEESGSGANPDQPVQAPARHDATPAPPKDCKRVSRRVRGERLDAALTIARKAGCELRVVEQDGQALAVTDDFSPSRINVRVEDGQVVSVAGLF